MGGEGEHCTTKHHAMDNCGEYRLAHVVMLLVCIMHSSYMESCTNFDFWRGWKAVGTNDDVGMRSQGSNIPNPEVRAAMELDLFSCEVTQSSFYVSRFRQSVGNVSGLFGPGTCDVCTKTIW